jgi:predicted RNA-binding protein YlxR (DUF448 family)
MAADRVDSDSGRPGSVPTPVRTCVGCRRQAAKSDLLRVVAVQSPTGVIVEADRRALRPGRGAYLHPDRACLDLALRRRALPRALRVPGPLDTDALAAAIDAGAATQETR